MEGFSVFRGGGRRLGTAVLACALAASMLTARPAPESKSTEDWAVRLAEGDSIEAVAARAGASAWRPVGSLPDTYVLVFEATQISFVRDSEGVADLGEWIARNPEVLWEEKQVGRIRVTRSAPQTEPLFPEQWHLQNTGQWGGTPFVDVNVEGVWASGYTGKGVGVSVVDTGTQFNHPELQPNFVKGRDEWDNDNDPSPEDTDENHGTAVAGIILAAANDRDGVGIAPEAGLYPVRLLRNGDGIPDSDEADALGIWPEEVFVSNNSWGPSDKDGVSLSPIGSLVKSTFEHAETARNGKGTLYVWAAGNGRALGQRADYDGYNSAIQTISVGAIGHDGRVTDYSEPGACVFIAAPSYGPVRGILTTDRVGLPGYASGDSTTDFSGTSAAAPMVSGVVALMLEANPELSWRDVQHILARTAVLTDRFNAGWFVNAAGFHLHEDYGFGRIDALAAVRLAERWTPVAPAIERSQSTFSGIAIPDNGSASRTLMISGDITVEQVEVSLSLTHSLWRQLEIAIISPAGTRSVLSRPFEEQSTGFGSYTFMTVQMWGESGKGQWRVEVRDTQTGTTGFISSVAIRVNGTLGSPAVSPMLNTSSIAVDRWPKRIEAADWIQQSGGENLEVLSAIPLERGTVRFADGQLWFEPPVDQFGYFPLSVCVQTESGEARTFLVELERPWLATDGLATATIAHLGTTADIRVFPARGTLADSGPDLSYFPNPDAIDFSGADRFSLGPVGAETSVSVPVLYKRDWSFETDGRDAHIDLGLENHPLNQRFTVEGWFRADGWGEAQTGFGRIFDKDTFLIFINAYDHLNYNDASLVVFTDFANGVSGVFNTAANTVALKDWTHVAVTFDYLRSPQVSVFINGLRLSTTSPSDLTPPGAGTPLTSSLNTAAFVGDNLEGTRGFRGGFRDLRVWSTVRSDDEIEDAAEGEAPEDLDDLLVRLRAAQPGATSGTLEGTLGETAFYHDIEWLPAQSPWASWRAAWPDFSDVGGGWSAVPHIGSVFGDYFPWVFHVHLGWIWTHVEGEEGSQWFYRLGEHRGWMYWTRDSLPWIYSESRDTWLYYIADSNWFFDARLREWLTLP